MAYKSVSIRPSTNLASADYDEATQDLLVTWSRDGSQGVYHGVDARTVDELSRAPSAGRFIHYFLKGVYPYENV
jgi:hypothetical protein